MTNIAKHTPVTALSGPLSPFGSIEGFETCQRMAKALSGSTFIPKEFKNNVGDCLILLETASRTNMPIMALMQNMYVVHGKPSFSSSFMAGLINNSRRFDSPLQFKYSNDRTSCYAYATKDGQEFKSITVSIDMAKKEGWTSKKGSKWVTMPEVMLQYRAISFFARAYCADLIMGMRSSDELQDMPAASTGSQEQATAVDDLNKRFAEKSEPGEQTPATGKGEDDEVIDAETGEATPTPQEEDEQGGLQPDQEKKNVRTRPSVIDKFKVEIDAIETSGKVDTWRSKHAKRIETNLPKDSDQDAVFLHAEQRYQALLSQEKKPQHLEFISCPDGKGNVPAEYCKECESREGCPAW